MANPVGSGSQCGQKFEGMNCVSKFNSFVQYAKVAETQGVDTVQIANLLRKSTEEMQKCFQTPLSQKLTPQEPESSG